MTRREYGTKKHGYGLGQIKLKVIEALYDKMDLI